MSSGFSTAPHGGMARLPFVTDCTKRVLSSCGKVRRSKKPPPGDTISTPWHFWQKSLYMRLPRTTSSASGGGPAGGAGGFGSLGSISTCDGGGGAAAGGGGPALAAAAASTRPARARE